MPGTITIADANGTVVLPVTDQVIQAIDAQRQTQMIPGVGGTPTPQYPDWKSYLVAAATRQVIVPAAQTAAAAMLNGMVPTPMALTLPTITAAHGTPITPAQVVATGGTGSGYVFSAAGLPAGLSINSSTGQISGTPATAGTYQYTVTATDPYGNSAVMSGSITVS